MANFLSSLRLKHGVMDTADAGLKASIAANECAAKWCGGVVVAGLAIEIILAWVRPPRDSWLDVWGSVIADSLVAMGVFGELLFSARSSKCHGELQRRSEVAIASATERAETARLEAEQLRAQLSWRGLSTAQREKFVGFLPRSQGSVTLEYVLGDVESFNFASLLGDGFHARGWGVGLLGGTYGSALEFGIQVEPDTEVSEMIHVAFAAADIQFAPGTVTNYGISHGSAGGGGPSHCRIYVGPKPPNR